MIDKKVFKVAKSNALIEASQKLSINEQRVLLVALSKIGKDEKLTSQKMYTVSVHELEEITGNEAKKMLSGRKKVVDGKMVTGWWFDIIKKLKSRQVTVFTDKQGNALPHGAIVMSWIQTIAYDEPEQEFNLRFNTDMAHYISELFEGGRFTLFDAAICARMKSGYGPRLYELLKMKKTCMADNRNSKEAKERFSLDDLRVHFHCEDSHAEFKDFKKRVIIPAFADVNKTSDLAVDWKAQRIGSRSITHIDVTMKQLKKPRYITEEEKAAKKEAEAKKANPPRSNVTKMPAPQPQQPQRSDQMTKVGQQNLANIKAMLGSRHAQ